MRLCKSGRHDMDVVGTTKGKTPTSGHTCRACNRETNREAKRRERAAANGKPYVPLTPRLDEEGVEELIVWGTGPDSSYEERAGHRNAWLTAAVTWMEDGACNNVDPELSYMPPKRKDEEPIMETGTEDDRRKVSPTAAAKLVCQGCPVLEQCKEYALTWHEEHGVWGGMSVLERKRVWKAQELSSVA